TLLRSHRGPGGIPHGGTHPRDDVLQPGIPLRRGPLCCRPRRARGSGPHHRRPHPGRSGRMERCRRRTRPRQGVRRRPLLHRRTAEDDRRGGPGLPLRRLDDGSHRHSGERGAGRGGTRSALPGRRATGVRGSGRIQRRTSRPGRRLRRRGHRGVGSRQSARVVGGRGEGARGGGGPHHRPRPRRPGHAMNGIPSPSEAVWYVGPLPLRAYAIAIITGILIGGWLASRRYRERGGPEGVLVDALMWAVPAGIIGARIYHVISSPAAYFRPGGDPIKALYIWEGGLGIWGAIPAGAGVAWWY